MDFTKDSVSASNPVTFKAYLASLTLHQDRVEITRKFMGKIGGARNAVIHLSNVPKVQYKEPSRLINGYIYFADLTDPARITAWNTDTEKQIAGNSHAVMFTWQQRDTFTKARNAIDAAMQSGS
jgi:hypothetical protein